MGEWWVRGVRGWGGARGEDSDGGECHLVVWRVTAAEATDGAGLKAVSP